MTAERETRGPEESGLLQGFTGAGLRARDAEQLELVMRAINEGVYDWDIATGSIYYSEGVHRAVGMSPEDIRTPEDWRRRIHPDDVAVYDAALVAHFKGKTDRFECDYRFRSRDGGWRWARQHGIATRDAGGRAVRLTGSTGDISELKRMEAALKESEERYALATQAATEGIYDWDIAAGTLYLSDRAKEFFALAGRQPTSRLWAERVHPEDYPAYREAVIRCLKGRAPRLELEYRISSVEDGWRWILDRGLTRRDGAGRATRLVGAISDITPRKMAEAELRRAHEDVSEALERQTATAEILRVISSSPTDVQPVFEAIAANARRLLGGRQAVVTRRIDNTLHLAAYTKTTPEGDAALLRLFPTQITGQGVMGKAIVGKGPAIVTDVETDPAYSETFRAGARIRGIRSMLGVPMVREGEAIGVINVTRSVPGGFTDHETTLLKTFADQAVIAIENVRLFNETTEALERQTATAEILKVIASSPSDVQPVFDAIAQSGMKLFPGAAIAVALPDGDRVRAAAIATEDPVRAAAWSERFPTPLSPDRLHGTAILERRLIDIPDAEAAVNGPLEVGVRNFLATGNKAITVVPMVRGEAAIGAISVIRSLAGALSPSQIALLRTFADQAVIAIENVRLFNETKEALERQTATAEILKVIASSPSDVQPVFDAIVRSAARLFGRMAGLRLIEADGLRRKAQANVRVAEFHGADLMPVDRDSLIGRVVLEGRAMQLTDTSGPDSTPYARANARQFAFRSLAAAPLVRDGVVIGTIAVSSPSPGALTEKQMSLLATFADQAVIAIENVRLFHELEEKSRQLEEASKHKSQFLASMSHELRTPLNAILGFNEMILGQVYGEVPGELKEPLEDIQKSGKHLLRLINNVLDLAKIEAGRMELALSDYSVHDTVMSVHSTLRPLAAEKGLEFLVDVPNDLPLAFGDGGRIAQCLMNLAGNSLKFTKTGRVEIAVFEKDGRLTWRVADTGIGIAKEKIGGLFTEFKQTDATIASEYGGTGLGLSITRQFIEMHGGRIWVESEPGKGATFLFEIPLRAGGP